MSVDVADRLLTVDEFYLLSDSPEGGKDGAVRGRVVMSLPPSGAHGMRLARIDRRLKAGFAVACIELRIDEVVDLRG